MRWASSYRLPVAALAVVGLVTGLLVATVGMASAVTGPVTIGGTRPVDVAISGGTVVWADRTRGDYDIYAWDASTGETTRLTDDSSDQIQPDIDGDIVVWTDYRHGNAEIYMYDLLTGTESRLVKAGNDQVLPSISGTWVVWEDYRSSYSPGIYGIDLAAPIAGGFRIASGYNAPHRRPVVGGDLVVWEDYSAQAAQSGDVDITGADLAVFNPSTPEYLTIADATSIERAPWTDGRYVAWSQDDEEGANVFALDVQTDERVTLADGAGEQALPVVANGVAYWLENVYGTRMHYKTYDFESGRAATFNSYGTADMTEFDASGTNAVWLQSAGGEWKVSAVINDESGASFASMVEGAALRLSWVPSRLAQLVTGGDDEPPAIVSATVDAGETGVEAARPLAVYFSEALDAASVDAEAVRLVDEQDGEPVETDVAYSALADAISVTPAAPLDEGVYTLKVSGAVADEAGNALGQDFVATFATDFTLFADTRKPSVPIVVDIRTVGRDQVWFDWKRSSDNVGVVGYRVYRYFEPMDSGNIGSATEVADVATTKATFDMAADERTPRKVTYYYAVRSYDASGNISGVSTNMSPNPHGTYVYGANTNNCMMCHSVHGGVQDLGALGAKSAAACYLCHGNTTTSEYGYGSTIDEQYDFFEDTTETAKATATRHRNDYAMARQAECDMCHTPHRKPANYLSGSYEASTSYSKMIKSPTDPSKQATDATQVYEYSTDQAPFGNGFCTDCHGTQSAYIAGWAGGQAYANAGGDHSTGFEAGAHGSTVVLYGQRGSFDRGPQVQCNACHNEHATQTQGLVDYRQSGVRDTTYEQAGLCFACHSASSAETRVAGSSVPFAWNGRDVQAQFAKGAGTGSSHPYSVIVTTSGPVAQAGSWAQTTEADFGTDTLSNTETTPTGNGAVQLEYTGTPAQSGVTAGAVPTSDIQTGNWSSPDGGAEWDDIDEYPTADDTDYVYPNGGTEIRFGIDGFSVPTNATNISVSARMRTRDSGSGTSNRWVKWRTGGTWRSLTSRNPGTSWTDYDETITEPGNGVWTPAEVNAIDGLGLDSSDQNPQPQVSQLYLEVTYDVPAIAGGYKGSGYAQTGNIVVPGTHSGWKTLTVNTDIPVDTSMTVDVIDIDTGSAFSGYDDLVMSDGTNNISLALPAGINHATDPQIKLRADLFGDVTVPVARVVNDAFGDSVFDTTTPLPRWYDVPTLGGATDPDAGTGSTATYFSDDFNRTNGAPGNGWTTSGDTPAWAINSNNLYSIGDSNADYETSLVYRTIDLSGLTSPRLGFTYQWSGYEAGETLEVIYSSNGGSTWQTLTTYDLDPDTGLTTADLDLTTVQSANANTIGYRTYRNFNNESIRIDDYAITYTQAGTPTDIWPKEAGGFLTLRGEGADLEGTTDEGYFVYMSAADYGWFTSATDGWEMVSRVLSETVTDTNGRSGVMMRTGSGYGTSSGQALEADSQSAGVYLTGDGSVKFVTRSSNGGSASEQTVGSVTAPRWVKLTFDGTNSWQGWYSSDGSAWTEIGSAVTFTPGTAMALGLAQTSGDNGTFEDASFDDWSVTEQVTVPDATKTPQLLDWTVTYDYIPAPDAASGELTCANCHNTHVVQEGGTGVWDMDRVSNPNNTKNLWTGTAEDFCLTCHDGSAPTAQMSASTIVPYSVGFTTMSSATYPFFPGWDKTESGATWSGGAHTNSGVRNMDVGCEDCHDPHASDNDRLTAFTRTGTAQHAAINRDNSSTYAEEDLCFECHTNDRTPNCEGGMCHAGGTTPFDDIDVQTAFGQTYKHDVSSATWEGRHSDLEDADDLGDANRHVECVDCHDPHAASAADPMRGSMGITSTVDNGNWGVPSDWEPGRVGVDSNTYEANVCFKCHSDYVDLPTGSMDIAQQFNPANQSGHNVVGNVWPKTSFTVGASTYTWDQVPSSIFLSGWSTSSMMDCSSCHTGDNTNARGPHGSSVEYLIDEDYPADYATTSLSSATSGMDANTICAKCHTDLDQANDAHREGDHRGTDGECNDCHIAIPHGWKRPRLIGYSDDPAPYATNSDALYRIRLRSHTLNGWSQDGYCMTQGPSEGCYDAYHGTYFDEVTESWP